MNPGQKIRGVKAAIVVAVDESGKISGWDLLQMRHPLREESAPFTGIYEIKVKTEAKRCGLQLLSYIQQWLELEKLHRAKGR